MTHPAPYTPRDYSRLRGLKGISDEQVEVHLKLYQGYVSRSNKLRTDLNAMSAEGKQGDPRWQEMRRRFGWEYDGMRLHESYFDALRPGGDGSLSPDNRFGALAAKQYGSVESWKTDLASVAKMPGVGWANVYLDPVDGRILNCWVTLHDDGHPVGCRLLLALDVWEHAFSVYLEPTERAPYIEDFFANVAWGVVASRLT